MTMEIPSEVSKDTEHTVGVGIIAAAAEMLSKVTTNSWRKGRWGWVAVFDTEEGRVEVQPYRNQARIEGERGDYYYDTPKELAGSIRSRLARQKAAQIEEDKRQAKAARRGKMTRECEKTMREELCKIFGQEVVDAFFDVTAYVEEVKDATEADGSPMEKVTARVSVFVTKNIRAERVSPLEAIRFATLMQTAGYFACNKANTTEKVGKCPLHGDAPCPA